jgi:hypothetical protein
MNANTWCIMKREGKILRDKIQTNMKPGQPIRFLMVVIAVLCGSGLGLLEGGCSQKAATTFDPPYPERNVNGNPIFVVFEGRVPCTIPKCTVTKVQLVLYQNQETGAPATYWLGLVHVGLGNERIVTEGAWEIQHGVNQYPEGVVYKIDSKTDVAFQYYWRVSDRILLILDENLSPKVGNAAWNYALSRYDAPYGPRAYE